jgi:hypothetical protein
MMRKFQFLGSSDIYACGGCGLQREMATAATA